MNCRILINYRREDSRGSTGRLYDRLSDHFTHEQVFMDVDTIEPGEDFVKVIEEAVTSCDVFIAVIGPDWLTIENRKEQRRIDDPDDFVRLEIVAALERDIRVIPVLVEGATMPQISDMPSALKPLARRNAIEISHTRFDLDANRLIQAVESALEQIMKEKKAQEDAKRIAKGLSPAEAAERQAKIAKLMTDARAALEREDWNSARKIYRYVLMAQSDHAAAQAGLQKAQHKQKLADLYGRALVFQDNQQLDKALDTLKQLLNLDGSYKDVRVRIKAIEDSLAKRIAHQIPHVSPPLPVDENSNKPIKEIRSIPRWAILGGSSLGLIILISIVGLWGLCQIVDCNGTETPEPTSPKQPTLTKVVHLTEMATREPINTKTPTSTTEVFIEVASPISLPKVKVSRPSEQEYTNLPNIWDIVEGDKGPTSPTTNYFNAMVNSNSVYGWGALWCGRDNQNLQEILSPLSMNLVVNDRTLTDDEVVEFFTIKNGQSCYRWGTKLSNWEPGETVRVELRYFLKETIFDGNYYTYGGNYNLVITIKVR